jgi:hypothetical protein
VAAWKESDVGLAFETDETRVLGCRLHHRPVDELLPRAPDDEEVSQRQREHEDNAEDVEKKNLVHVFF